MRYSIYTTVDITSTGQHRFEPARAFEYNQEQNFQTVLQTLGIRANIVFDSKPAVSKVQGQIFGFNTNDIINVWIFYFETEKDHFYQVGDDPLAYLLEDFQGVPYISNLNESMDQNYPVFVTDGPSKNIIFKKI